METYVDGKRENNFMFRLSLKGREKYDKPKKPSRGYGLYSSLVAWCGNRL
jgi:hypothetical protein